MPGLVQIEDKAFFGCTGLQYATIPDTVKWVGKQAFFGCDNLIHIIVPKHLKLKAKDFLPKVGPFYKARITFM